MTSHPPGWTTADEAELGQPKQGDGAGLYQRIPAPPLTTQTAEAACTREPRP